MGLRWFERRRPGGGAADADTDTSSIRVWTYPALDMDRILNAPDLHARVEHLVTSAPERYDRFTGTGLDRWIDSLRSPALLELENQCRVNRQLIERYAGQAREELERAQGAEREAAERLCLARRALDRLCLGLLDPRTREYAEEAGHRPR